MKIKKSEKPKHSLRTLLILWFLVFSLAPLAFITLFSLFKFDDVVRTLLKERLKGNSREVYQQIDTYQRDLKNRTLEHSLQKDLSYFLFRNEKSEINKRIRRFFANNESLQKISVYDQEGILLVALEKSNDQFIHHEHLETGDFRLSSEFITLMSGEERQKEVLEFKSKESIVLTSIAKIYTDKNRLIGYIEESFSLDRKFIESMWGHFQVSTMFLSTDGRVNLSYFSSKEGRKIKYSDSKSFTELLHQNESYSYYWKPVRWGDQSYVLGVGSSNKAAQEFLKNMGLAFYGVVGVVFVFLLILSLIISNFVLKPLYNLLEATQNLNLDSGKIELKADENSEFGLLTKSFNRMSSRVYHSQLELRKNINKLKKANEQIKEAQARMVQSEKMASLGQLVAGVAHELNNPIGFIHSNMTHLKEYSESLVKLVEVAEEDSKQLEAQKQELEFDYIKEDLPKLIRSCEEGSRRTKDIVLGLRNFSRLDEDTIKMVDIHEGIENTLNLISGELKGRIKVIKKFNLKENISCYPGQMNQVFMNMLTNAAQAIKGDGQIEITTEKINGHQIGIKFKDSGRGIPEDEQAKIFDPFYTTKNQGQGTGLGLSISYGIIKKHGGEIRVISDVGNGSEFIILLPTDHS